MDPSAASIATQRDSELIARLRRHDSAAAGEFYERYGKILFALILNIVGDRRHAEDLLAEVLLKASNKLQSFATNDFALRPWLLILARNHALQFRGGIHDMQERTHEWDSLEFPALYVKCAPAEGVAPENAVKRAFLNLAETDRLILELAWFEGMSFEEIAPRINLPLSEVIKSAKGSLSRIREL